MPANALMHIFSVSLSPCSNPAQCPSGSSSSCPFNYVEHFTQHTSRGSNACSQACPAPQSLPSHSTGPLARSDSFMRVRTSIAVAPLPCPTYAPDDHPKAGCPHKLPGRLASLQPVRVPCGGMRTGPASLAPQSLGMSRGAAETLS